MAKNNINKPTINWIKYTSQAMLKRLNLAKRILLFDIEINNQAPKSANGIAGIPKRSKTDLSMSL